MEPTDRELAKNLAAQTLKVSALQAQIDAQSIQLEKITTLLERQLAITAAPSAPIIVQQAHQIVNAIDASTTINIRPWDGDRRLCVATADIAAAFAENPRLKNTCSMATTK